MDTRLRSDVLFVLFFLLLLAHNGAAALTLSELEWSAGSSSQVKVGNASGDIILNKTLTLSASPSGYGYSNVQYTFAPQSGFSGNTAILGLSSTSVVNATLQVTVSLTIPHDFDAVDDDLEATNFDIGTLTITGTEMNSSTWSPTNGPQGQDTLPLKLQVKNEISLERIELKKEDGSISDITSSSTVSLQAGQDVEFIFHVRNTYENSTGVEFNQATVDMEIEDIGDDSTSLSNIDPGETKSKGIDFSIDEDGNFDVVVKLQGEDEFGGLHGLVKEFTLDISAAPEEPEDSDGDGIDDAHDQCPTSAPYCTVNAQGCPLDKDNDGLCDAIDAVDNSLIIPQQTQEQQETQQSSSSLKPAANETKETKKKSGKDESSYFLPFLIGFISGAIIAVGFFYLLRS